MNLRMSFLRTNRFGNFAQRTDIYLFALIKFVYAPQLSLQCVYHLKSLKNGVSI